MFSFLLKFLSDLSIYDSLSQNILLAPGNRAGPSNSQESSDSPYFSPKP
jgi:hypothetical protein